MADVASTTADSARPTKPDENKYKSELAELEKAHKAAQADFNNARSKLDGAKTGKGSPQQDKWNELLKEQQEIRAKQSAFKSSRQVQQTRYDANDREIKSLIQQQKDTKQRLGFKSAGEIESKIASLMAEVDSGKLKLVDEKKKLAEVSALRRQIKGFGGIDEMEAQIENKKRENAELKKTFDNAETKALSDRYETNSKEMDSIKASRDDSNKNWSKLKGERDAKHEKQEETWKAIQAHKDAYFSQRKEYKEYEDKLYQARREKQKQERDSYEKEKRRKIAESHLDEASAPAFTDEILTAEGIIKHFDPSYGTAAGPTGPGKFAASADRKVDEAGFKGMTVMKKEETDFFVGTGGKKKGSKGSKASSSTSTGKFSVGVDIIQGLSKLGVEAPSSQAEVPATIEKLKEKVADWKKNQAAQTEKNIEKAKKEIEKLEQEPIETESSAPRARGPRTDRSKKGALKGSGISADGQENGVSASAVRDEERNGVADATHDLKAAKLEDSETPDIASS